MKNIELVRELCSSLGLGVTAHWSGALTVWDNETADREVEASPLIRALREAAAAGNVEAGLMADEAGRGALPLPTLRLRWEPLATDGRVITYPDPGDEPRTWCAKTAHGEVFVSKDGHGWRVAAMPGGVEERELADRFVEACFACARAEEVYFARAKVWGEKRPALWNVAQDTVLNTAFATPEVRRRIEEAEAAAKVLRRREEEAEEEIDNVYVAVRHLVDRLDVEHLSRSNAHWAVHVVQEASADRDTLAAWVGREYPKGSTARVNLLSRGRRNEDLIAAELKKYGGTLLDSKARLLRDVNTVARFLVNELYDGSPRYAAELRDFCYRAIRLLEFDSAVRGAADDIDHRGAAPGFKSRAEIDEERND